MRVLITGGAGFIGSHLAEELLSRGLDVAVLDDLSTGSLSNIDHLMGSPGFSFERGSILDTSRLSGLVEKASVIYHLAAAVGVKYVLDNPVAALLVNSHGTEQVLRLAYTFGGKKVVLASSSEVYGKTTKVPFSEEDDSIIGPTSVARWGYSCSKAFDEFLALAYHQQRNLPVVVLRFFNTVGPRQSGSYGMVLPRFVTQAMAHEPITVYGDGSQRRSFTNVKDVVKAVADISMVPQAEGQVFNIGSDREITIQQLAELVRTTLASNSEIVRIPYSEVYGEAFEDPERRLPDLTKIRRYIDYHPKTDLPAVIKAIANHWTKPASKGKEVLSKRV